MLKEVFSCVFMPMSSCFLASKMFSLDFNRYDFLSMFPNVSTVCPLQLNHFSLDLEDVDISSKDYLAREEDITLHECKMLDQSLGLDPMNLSFDQELHASLNGMLHVACVLCLV